MKKQQLEESISFLLGKGFVSPEAGIILGTGLGGLENEIENKIEIAYKDVPNFPSSTVPSHSGKLIFGELAGKKVVVMSGRFHLYEGFSNWEVTYGVRVLNGLGIKNLIITNAAGAINLSYKKGDIMLINDHINLQGGSPLAFKEVASFGGQFVDMSEPYSFKNIDLLKSIANKRGLKLKEGVYAGVFGPQLETRAEYRMLQILEADAVGMSTVSEVIVANHLGLNCTALSVITDECDPKNLQTATIAEIIAAAKSAEPNLKLLVIDLIELF